MLKQIMLGMLVTGGVLSANPWTEDDLSHFKGMDAKKCCDSIPTPCCERSSSHRDREVAYFYLTPTDAVTPVANNSPITWVATRYTVKSDGINVGAVSPATTSPDIVFSDEGIYSITYTVFAGTTILTTLSPDSFTMELQLNGSSVAGSRFTATLPLTLTVPPTLDEQELVGQVITYIPAGAQLQLVNVSGYSIQTENEDGGNGNFASIAIRKIARSIN